MSDDSDGAEELNMAQRLFANKRTDRNLWWLTYGLMAGGAALAIAASRSRKLVFLFWAPGRLHRAMWESGSYLQTLKRDVPQLRTSTRGFPA